jgi:hypothetical protein
MRFLRIIVSIALVTNLFFMLDVFAQSNTNSIQIIKPIVRVSAPGQSMSSAYFQIQNKGTTADKLVGVTFSHAKEVQIHEMKMDMDRMMMRQINFIEIPPNGSVELKPGGYHLMLMGLDNPIKEGEQLKMTLQFEKAGKVDVTFSSESMSNMHRH